MTGICLDDNRYAAGRGAHLTLKWAEKAGILFGKIPGMVEALTAKARAWESERGTKFSYDGLAQKLYEGIQLSDGKAGSLITYTRTDGLHISDEAVKDIRSFVTERYGQNFISATPQKIFKKVKNAQKSHEAIRPTDIQRIPSSLTKILDEDPLKLYTLIWCRTTACQMEPATIEQVTEEIEATRFNTGISAMMEFLNVEYKVQDSGHNKF